jgi:hypothetical protein
MFTVSLRRTPWLEAALVIPHTLFGKILTMSAGMTTHQTMVRGRKEHQERKRRREGNGKGERTGLESSLAAAELRELGRWFGKIHSLTTVRGLPKYLNTAL